MAKQSEARAKLSLDPAPFEKGAKAIVNAANQMSAQMGATFKAAGVAILAAFGAKTISAIANTVRETLEFGEQMANAAKRTGMAAGQFYLFNEAMTKGIGMKTAAALLGKNAEVLTRSANVFRDVSIKLWVIGEKIRGFWLGLVERIAPILSTILDGTLGDQLIDAGSQFGEALAEGVETIYQLAKDGKLWQTFKDGFTIAFEYAGERMVWLANLGYDALKVIFSSAFVEGITNAASQVWGAVKAFAHDFGVEIGNAFLEVWLDIQEMLNGFLGKIDRWLNKIGVTTNEVFAMHTKGRDDTSNDINSQRPAIGGPTPVADAAVSIADKVKNIFSGAKFGNSDDLNSKIGAFTEGLKETFTKYQKEQKDHPATHYENNTRRVASGADSLAAIGAGGGVYLGLSMLDVNKNQLRELQSINAKLGGGPQLQTSTLQPARSLNAVSRGQTASPFASPVLSTGHL